LGALEAAIAAYLLFGRHSVAKLWLVFWLSSNFLMYRCANAYLHLKTCPCLGTIASALPLKKGEVDFLLLTTVLCLFFGSGFTLVSMLSERRAAKQIAAIGEKFGKEAPEKMELHDGEGVVTDQVPQSPRGQAI
jgi:hypothetical protein